VKRALHQRFFFRYTLRAAMAGIIICLMYIFVFQIKTDLGHDFNVALGKYLMGLSFSMALVSSTSPTRSCSPAGSCTSPWGVTTAR